MRKALVKTPVFHQPIFEEKRKYLQRMKSTHFINAADAKKINHTKCLMRPWLCIALFMKSGKGDNNKYVYVKAARR